MADAGLTVLILAGGAGTRIRALFPDRPKGLIPVAGRPFLEHQMRVLERHGLRRFVLCVGERADQIRGHFGDGSHLGLEIAYSHEAEPRGTGGALQQAAEFFDAPCLVLNGDTYSEMDYRALIAAHRAHAGAIGTLTVAAVPDAARYGTVVLDATDRIVAFREKAATRGAGLVSAGAYVLEPEILEWIAGAGSVSLENQVFPALLAAGRPLFGFRTDASFYDMGTPEGFRALDALLASSGSHGTVHPGT